jgi:rare lipoprotein A
MSRRVVAAALCVACFVMPAIGQEGTASYYGPGFHGRTTASGERFNQQAATCAHRTLRFGARVKVINLRNGKSATCRVNDRGPYAGGRIIDVSKGIAAQLGMIRSGTAPVRITVIK